MKTSRTLPLIAVASLLMLAACDPAAPGTTDINTDVEAEAEGTMTMSMKDLLKLGKNYTCTFADVDDEGNRTDGTVYVQGETNFRGNFMITDAKGAKMNSQMLMTNNTTYLWSDDEPQGIMMTLDPEEDGLFGDDVEEGDDAVIEEDEPLELDCKKWTPNSAMFAVPTDHEFIDFQAQLEAMMKQTGGSQCGMCDQIPDEQGKEECRSALNC